MTQSGLARELGVTQQAVSAWINGRLRPNGERISRIQELLGIAKNEWDLPPEAAEEEVSPASRSVERESTNAELPADDPTGT